MAQGLSPAAGIFNTVAGTGITNYYGDGGLATSADLAYPEGVAVDASGDLYIADTYNFVVRKVSAFTGVITTVAGNHTEGFSGDGGLATNAMLSYPDGIAVDTSGNLYIADSVNNRIRKVTASTGIITTVAGNGTAGYSGDGGQATSAMLDEPQGVAVDTSGNLYIVDTLNYRIRKVAASTGVISTVAGDGIEGYSGDGQQATTVEIHPTGLAVDLSANLYIADSGNDRIRKVTASTGIITTVAGNGTAGYSGDGGQATSAEINDPQNVAVDEVGNLYIADNSNYRIRKVMAFTGNISTVAGIGATGLHGKCAASGIGGLATSTEICIFTGIAADSAGDFYLAGGYGASGMSHADDRLTALKGTGFSPYIKPAKSRGL
jgi:sugar lactone lactonase YvrE